MNVVKILLDATLDTNIYYFIKMTLTYYWNFLSWYFHINFKIIDLKHLMLHNIHDTMEILVSSENINQRSRNL